MTDTKYLKQRGATWYLQLGVPKDIQHLWQGAAIIVESLKTTDLTVAQELRWVRRTHYQAIFEGIRSGRNLTDAEIDAIAERAFGRRLAPLEEKQIGRYDEPEHNPDNANYGFDELSMILDDLGDAYTDHGVDRAIIDTINWYKREFGEEPTATIKEALFWAEIDAINGRRAALQG